LFISFHYGDLTITLALSQLRERIDQSGNWIHCFWAKVYIGEEYSSYSRPEMQKKIIMAVLIALVISVCYAFQSMGDLLEYYYQTMATSMYKQKLRNFCRYNLSDPIDGLNYTRLVYWEHRHLIYVPTNEQFQRRYMAIDILLGGFGRCGEFSQLYTGLCLANGIPVRLVVDQSEFTEYDLKNGLAAGDHQWCEVKVNGTWVPVEVTQSLEGSWGLIINQPHFYRDVWHKDVNNVEAIWIENGTIQTADVTSIYA
jgi:hypothetical protein